MLSRLIRDRKGQGLVEYGLLVAGIALVAIAGVSILGHKTSDLISTTAVILPGGHADDNAPIVSGKLVETAANADGNITVDAAGILAHNDEVRLNQNLGLGDTSVLVEEAPAYP
jgi:pilus assembly protein Flp/PilA